MSLYTSPPHRVSISRKDGGTRDNGGGTVLTPTQLQTAVPCSINTASATTKELFAQQNIEVTETVAFLSSVLTTPLAPGMILAADDTGETFRIEGISSGRTYAGIPAFTYAHCKRLA